MALREQGVQVDGRRLQLGRVERRGGRLAVPHGKATHGCCCWARGALGARNDSLGAARHRLCLCLRKGNRPHELGCRASVRTGAEISPVGRLIRAAIAGAHRCSALQPTARRFVLRAVVPSPFRPYTASNCMTCPSGHSPPAASHPAGGGAAAAGSAGASPGPCWIARQLAPQQATAALLHPKVRHPPRHSGRVVTRRATPPICLAQSRRIVAVPAVGSCALQPHLPRTLHLPLHLQPLHVLQLDACLRWPPGLHSKGRRMRGQMMQGCTCAAAAAGPRLSASQCNFKHAAQPSSWRLRITCACCAC